MPKHDGLSYRDAGVDIEAADRLVHRIARAARATHGPEVLGGIGGFASLFSLKALLDSAGGMAHPLLVAGTDGVGTKLKIAIEAGRHDTIGIDLVAMCVNDIVTTGARPLFFLDYFGTGRLQPDVAATVIEGIAQGCQQAGLALVGGETAELPGLYADGEYDLAGFAVGLVERSAVVDGRSVCPGDRLVGILSRGLHANGYSLARMSLFGRGRLKVDTRLENTGKILADVLLTPTAIYASLVDRWMQAGLPKAMAHITGGGLEGNIPRVLPNDIIATIDRRRWAPPEIFDLIARHGAVSSEEMFRTFNMGIGFVVVVQADNVTSTIEHAAKAGEVAVEIGEIREADGPARTEWSDRE